MIWYVSGIEYFLILKNRILVILIHLSHPFKEKIYGIDMGAKA